MPSPAEFNRAQDLMGDPTMSEEKKHRILCAEFPRRRAAIPRDPRERPGFRRMSAGRLQRESMPLGGDATEAVISDDGTDVEDDSRHGAQSLRTTAQQIAVRQHRAGGWQKFHYDDCLRGVRKLQPDGRRLQTVWRRMPVERQITRLSEDNPAEEETVRVRMRRGTFRALSNASIRLESQAAVDNAARAAAQTTIAPSNLRIRRPGFRRGASIPADLSLQATLRRADRHRQNERRAGPPAAEMPRPAHPAAPRVQMPRNLDPSATTASGARIRRETRNPAGATITRDPAPAPATSSAPIAPSVSRPAPPAPMMPPAAARPLYAGPAAPTGPLAGHLAAARAELTQNMQYSDVRFDGTAMPAMQPPRPHPNAPRNYGYPAVGPPPGMYPVAPQGTAYGVQHVQPQYYRGVPAPMAPGPMYATAASRAGYGPAGANNTVTAVQPYRNGQASSAYGVAHQPPAPPGYSGPRPV